MREKKAFALTTALLMMLAVFTVVGMTSVGAEDTTVVLKKPIEGEKWSLGNDYKIAWTFPNGDQSQIISIQIAGNYRLLPWWSWEASSNPGAKVPTSCTVRVPGASEFVEAGGTQNIGIEVRYYSQPGVEATATDYRTVTIVDSSPPQITIPSEPQTFVLGADAFTAARFSDAPSSGSRLDLSSVRVTVDGQSAPAEMVTVGNFMLSEYQMQMETDWLSLGKHKVTIFVADNAGNVARASWVVQVVGA